jgi:hypothetical protein
MNIRKYEYLILQLYVILDKFNSLISIRKEHHHVDF